LFSDLLHEKRPAVVMAEAGRDISIAYQVSISE
jgi:hypothetical protein